ncbi:agmatine deiminase family protein [Kitasatospora mediocidica]|uniref:agmatine deiminase family protein n=1 Tax=Kitasatospora mediocidica TaxID=58352 RepID=UPI00055DE804|nr:agmatine deiminase family protein [Kitasatospora mediocidica]
MRNLPPSRRTVLRAGSALAALAALEGCTSSPPGPEDSTPPSPTASATGPVRLMPAEWLPHTRTFMAWPALTEVWGDQLPDVQQDIAHLAQAVAQFEPVVLMASPDQVAAARQLCGSSVEVIPLPVDDLWARDTGPTFVTGPQGALSGVDLNFNGWGNKQTHANDSQVAGRLLDTYRIPRVQAPITGEGGAIEVDGMGTLMATESSLVNPNRNPGRTRDQIQADLQDLFGVRKVIWFKGVAGQDITDCHVDALARFVQPGVVVLHRPGPDTPPDIWSTASDQAQQVLRTATDADGRSLRVVEITEPDFTKISGQGKNFLATYVNFYVVNGAVIMPRFGDQAADEKAAATLGELHPGRKIVQLTIDAIAAGGGGIHCSTQQQPVTAAATP